MPNSVIIEHLSGSKAHRIEPFPMDGLTELSIGRTPGSSIVYDTGRDDAVSRDHAVIRVQQGDEPRFRIMDKGSKNGTLLNDQPITAEQEILPGDTVELGRGGPKFRFDVQPPMAHLVKRTRTYSTEGIGATRTIDMEDLAARAAAASQETNTVKPSIGRNTLMFELSKQKAQTNRTWMYVLAGVLGLVAIGGGGLVYQNHLTATKAQEDAAAKVAEARNEAASKIATATSALKAQMGMSAEDIARKYGNATVLIRTHWRLYDSKSGKPLYHRYLTRDKKRFPVYVKFKDRVFRWLTTDDENQSNVPIGTPPGMDTKGSGFVINEQGYIMTNKHVVYPWATGYSDKESLDDDVGLLYTYNTSEPPVPFHPSANRDLRDWKPGEDEGIVFKADKPVAIDDQFHSFEGRNDKLEVYFPGNPLSSAAKLVRPSAQADVAEIKVDTQQPLSYVTMADDDDVRVGEKVFVLGYPGFSSKTIAIIQSAEMGRIGQSQRQVLPEPTVTDGLVSQKSGGVQQQGQITTVGAMGETYQLTVPTSSGNSGGPVFNASGKVVGLFTYGLAGHETTTYAVPIHFARDLMKVQRSN